jgi:hypothetical protein
MRIVGPATNTKAASTTASTMLMFDNHWMPLATPLTAEATNAIVSTTMMTTSNAVGASPRKPPACRPPPICRAPRPSEAADPKSVAKIAITSIARPIGPSQRRAPSSGSKAELIRERRRLRKVL